MNQEFRIEGDPLSPSGPQILRLFIDNILTDSCASQIEYDRDFAKLELRYEKLLQQIPDVDYSKLGSEYHKSAGGDFISEDKTARELHEADLAKLIKAVPVDDADEVVGDIQDLEAIWVPSSARNGEIVRELETSAQDLVRPVEELMHKLERQRVKDWASYGRLLQLRIQSVVDDAKADMQVVVSTNESETLDDASVGHECDKRLANSIHAAIMATPTPADLPNSPLDRLDPACDF